MKLHDVVEVLNNSEWEGRGVITEVPSADDDWPVYLVTMATGKFTGWEGGFYLQDLRVVYKNLNVMKL